VKAKQKRIALIGLPILQSVNNLTNAAIARHAEETGRWKFVFSAEAAVETFKFLRTLECDGAIVRVLSTAMQREAMKIRFPLVNVSSYLDRPGVPTVRHDYVTTGRLAAQHLLEKGYQRFGCVLCPGGAYIQTRCQAFLETIAQQGLKATVFQLRSGPPGQVLPLADAERERFKAWVRQLQPPAGLLLTDDWDAPALMDCCREAGLQIPRDLVVISTGIHAEVLPLCKPPLSAVEEDQLAQARLVIETLDQLMSGKLAGVPIINVPPLCVAERESTATMAIEDRNVAHAVEFIRAHAGDGINVGDVVQRVRVSRVTLERHFRNAIGMTMHDYLIQHRIRRVQEMLGAKPPKTLQAIARQCGFPDRRRLNQVFRRMTGKTPAAWRAVESKATSKAG
jgi:LacI family transcriptional regulator